MKKTIETKLPEQITDDYEINKLNYLFVESERFKAFWTAHYTKIMFRFTFFQNTITLTGWAPDRKDDNNNNYDKVDLIKLKISVPAPPLKGKRLYLGNIRLKRADVKELYDDLINNPTAKFVLFTPVNYKDDKMSVGYIVNISKSKDDSGIISTKTTSKSADPSPPATRQ